MNTVQVALLVLNIFVVYRFRALQPIAEAYQHARADRSLSVAHVHAFCSDASASPLPAGGGTLWY
jgi:hypothetical protein